MECGNILVKSDEHGRKQGCEHGSGLRMQKSNGSLDGPLDDRNSETAKAVYLLMLVPHQLCLLVYICLYWTQLHIYIYMWYIYIYVYIYIQYIYIYTIYIYIIIYHIYIYITIIYRLSHIYHSVIGLIFTGSLGLHPVGDQSWPDLQRMGFYSDSIGY